MAGVPAIFAAAFESVLVRVDVPPPIASTGAMLLCGHMKRQSEVGLNLPNRIRSEGQTSGVRDKFLVPVTPPKAQSNAFIEPAKTV